VETSSSDENRKADGFVSTDAREHASPGGSPAWVAHVHFLFLGGIAIRGGLALVLVLCSVYILNLLDTSDLVGWLVLGLTTAGVAWVLLDHAYDIEGALARQAALAAVFDPDAYGARAEAADLLSGRLSLGAEVDLQRTVQGGEVVRGPDRAAGREPDFSCLIYHKNG